MTQRLNRSKIATLLAGEGIPLNVPVTVMGWVRTRRESKAGLAFVEVNDGSCFDNLQLVVAADWAGYSEVVPKLHAGVSLRASGLLVASQGGRQAVELQVSALEVVGDCDPAAYPIGKQKISYETLREFPHLRPRTNTFGAVGRLRDVLAAEVHAFFRGRGFRWVHTPLITANDAEGAGKAFQVTTLDLE
ncbi:MAG TPA: OB-fold nucleic acid binding domain-containing protein, partial [Fibrobacteria bacterium]|nr:OB-fold nucleic acid binding domain-containing protein [Fibrobacteria bacterium]